MTRRAPRRVVIDTNVVLSALLFARSGRPQAATALRLAWQEGRLEPLASRDTVTELIRALTYPKFRLTASEQEDLLADYLPACRSIPLPSTRPPTPECRDPSDAIFLELAVVGRAEFLITGDKDLLTLDGGFACPIVTAGRFLELFPSQS